MRWIWIDRFEEFQSKRSATAVKMVSVAEDHVHAQNPGYPSLPQSLVIEGLAQAGGILVGEANNFDEMVVLAKIPRIEFFGHAVAGDVLRYRVELQELRPEGAIVQAEATRNGEKMAAGEIVFAHLDRSKGIYGDADDRNAVFTREHLLGLLKMAKGAPTASNGQA